MDDLKTIFKPNVRWDDDDDDEWDYDVFMQSQAPVEAPTLHELGAHDEEERYRERQCAKQSTLEKLVAANVEEERIRQRQRSPESALDATLEEDIEDVVECISIDTEGERVHVDSDGDVIMGEPEDEFVSATPRRRRPPYNKPRTAWHAINKIDVTPRKSGYTSAYLRWKYALPSRPNHLENTTNVPSSLKIVDPDQDDEQSSAASKVVKEADDVDLEFWPGRPEAMTYYRNEFREIDDDGPQGWWRYCIPQATMTDDDLDSVFPESEEEELSSGAAPQLVEHDHLAKPDMWSDTAFDPPQVKEHSQSYISLEVNDDEMVRKISSHGFECYKDPMEEHVDTIPQQLENSQTSTLFDFYDEEDMRVVLPSGLEDVQTPESSDICNYEDIDIMPQKSDTSEVDEEEEDQVSHDIYGITDKLFERPATPEPEDSDVVSPYCDIPAHLIVRCQNPEPPELSDEDDEVVAGSIEDLLQGFVGSLDRDEAVVNNVPGSTIALEISDEEAEDSLSDSSQAADSPVTSASEDGGDHERKDSSADGYNESKPKIFVGDNKQGAAITDQNVMKHSEYAFAWIPEVAFHGEFDLEPLGSVNEHEILFEDKVGSAPSTHVFEDPDEVKLDGQSFDALFKIESVIEDDAGVAVDAKAAIDAAAAFVEDFDIDSTCGEQTDGKQPNINDGYADEISGNDTAISDHQDHTDSVEIEIAYREEDITGLQDLFSSHETDRVLAWLEQTDSEVSANSGETEVDSPCDTETACGFTEDGNQAALPDASPTDQQACFDRLTELLIEDVRTELYNFERAYDSDSHFTLVDNEIAIENIETVSECESEETVRGVTSTNTNFEEEFDTAHSHPRQAAGNDYLPVLESKDSANSQQSSESTQAQDETDSAEKTSQLLPLENIGEHTATSVIEHEAKILPSESILLTYKNEIRAAFSGDITAAGRAETSFSSPGFISSSSSWTRWACEAAKVALPFLFVGGVYLALGRLADQRVCIPTCPSYIYT